MFVTFQDFHHCLITNMRPYKKPKIENSSGNGNGNGDGDGNGNGNQASLEVKEKEKRNEAEKEDDGMTEEGGEGYLRLIDLPTEILVYILQSFLSHRRFQNSLFAFRASCKLSNQLVLNTTTRLSIDSFFCQNATRAMELASKFTRLKSLRLVGFQDLSASHFTLPSPPSSPSSSSSSPSQLASLSISSPPSSSLHSPLASLSVSSLSSHPSVFSSLSIPSLNAPLPPSLSPSPSSPSPSLSISLSASPSPPSPLPPFSIPRHLEKLTFPTHHHIDDSIILAISQTYSRTLKAIKVNPASPWSIHLTDKSFTQLLEKCGPSLRKLDYCIPTGLTFTSFRSLR
jgi:hypothetical protein